MTVLDIISTYTTVRGYNFEQEDDDDFIDKIFRKFSSIMMIVFSTLLGIYQLVGQPIECWCPNELGGRCGYAKTYCYITGTYVPISNNSVNLPSKNELKSHGIYYYQWVPFIFGLQALIFYSPRIVWKFFSSKSGFDLKNYIKSLKEDNSDLKESSSVKYVVNHIKATLDFQNNYNHRGIFRLRFFSKGIYLNLCYFGVKFLYAFVTFIQLFLMNYWLRDSYYSNLGFFDTIFGLHNINISQRFPRMTLCRFEVYILNDHQNQWVQCTLPINIYIEKMYLLIWAWLWILLAIIAVNILWNVYLFFNSSMFIKTRVDNKYKQSLLLDNLTKDGILMLRLVRSNTNDFYVSSILSYYSKILSYSPNKNQ